MNLLTLIAPALVTPVVDILKQLGGKFFGRSVDDEIKLAQVEVEKVKALAELDKPADNISQWVANLRASFRYIIVGYVVLIASILGILGYIYSPELRSVILLSFFDFAGASCSFIIGNRIYIGLKK